MKILSDLRDLRDRSEWDDVFLERGVRSVRITEGHTLHGAVPMWRLEIKSSDDVSDYGSFNEASVAWGIFLRAVRHMTFYSEMRSICI